MPRPFVEAEILAVDEAAIAAPPHRSRSRAHLVGAARCARRLFALVAAFLIPCGGSPAFAQEAAPPASISSPAGAASLPAGSPFRLVFDKGGITSLRFAGDKFDTDYLAEDATLGHVRVRYRMGESDWREFSTAEPAGASAGSGSGSGSGSGAGVGAGKGVEKYQPLASRPTRRATEHAFVYNPQSWLKNEYYADLELTERFHAEGDALYWTLFFRNPTHKPIELGDVFLPLPFNTTKRWDKTISYEQRVIQHQFISGHASFVYWMRPNGEGPYLVMVPVATCPLFEPARSEMNFAPARLEYAERGGVYIHSARRAAEDKAKGGTWRQPQTSVTMTPTNSQRDGVTYAFKFRWAKDYQGVRDILADEGLLDVNIVPGMTVQEGLETRFAIRSKNPIQSVTPEFADKTTVQAIDVTPTPGPAHAAPGREARRSETVVRTYRYAVTFNKLGENALTVKFDKNQSAVLEFFVTEKLQVLINKRSAFLTARHQHRDPSKWYNGLFSEWDMKAKVLRSPDDKDNLADYILASDDPALSKPPFIAAKNVDYPDAREIAALEYYLEHFVWGKLQMTEKEKYPYALYGIDNWKMNRDSKPGDRAGSTEHLWRAYDYPHVTALYWAMYQIASYYPELSHYAGKMEYLQRAYGTAKGFYTYPLKFANWSANELGNYNELIIADLIDELDAVGWKDKAAELRAHYEAKIAYYVNEQPDLFYSEYPFDPTGFESFGAFAHYGLVKFAGATKSPSPTLNFDKPALDRFVHEQLTGNIATRGWLEPSFYQLGVEGNLRYMSQMGGWAVLDYGLYFADDPYPYLRLGYAAILSSWALMNTGRADSNYGYWYPGAENDGGAGSAFVPAAYGSNWFGKSQPRGPWQYSGEIDLGFMAGLRGASTIVADDPILGLVAFGGQLTRTGTAIAVVPQDGVRRRFHVMRGTQRLHLLLERDGFAAERPIRIDAGLKDIAFTLENRVPAATAPSAAGTTPEHRTALTVSGLPAGRYQVLAGDRPIAELSGGARQTVQLPVAQPQVEVHIRAIG